MGNLMEEELVKDMTPKLVGETYRRFATDKSTQKTTYGIYECQYCGNPWEVIVYSITSGRTKSCGCLNGTKHGLTYHKFYGTWNKMLGRCYNIKSWAYQYYGGRGIIVCEEWLDAINFIKWAESTHPNIEGMTLDRIDNDKGYSPENCTWSDKTIQNINQRMKKNNTSGFVGVSWSKTHQFWVSYIHLNKKRYNVGTFKDKMEAVLARDNYIVENKLQHKLSTDYMKDK